MMTVIKIKESRMLHLKTIQENNLKTFYKDIKNKKTAFFILPYYIGIPTNLFYVDLAYIQMINKLY